METVRVEASASDMLNALLVEMTQGVIIMNIHSDEVQLNPEAWALMGKGGSNSGDMIISRDMFYQLCEASGQFWPEASARSARSYCEATVKECFLDQIKPPLVVDRMLGSTLCRIQTIVRPGAGLMWILTDISNSRSAHDGYRAQIGSTDLVKRSLEKIKIPMNGVMGMAGLLQRTELSDCQVVYAEGIVDAGSALSSLVRNIEDYTALEFGRVSLNPEPFDTARTVVNVVDQYHQSALDKNIFLAIEAPQKPSDGVIGDSKFFAKIVGILVGNAIRHTEFGGVTIGQKSRQGGTDRKPTSVISISISDTGAGLRPTELRAISAQLDTETSQNSCAANGIGVKLAVVANLIRLMGGCISIKSEMLHGTSVSFEIELPIAK